MTLKRKMPKPRFGWISQPRVSTFLLQNIQN